MRPLPSVLGFYKESKGPVEMTSRVYADQAGLYLHIPSHIRNRLEVVVGNRIEGRLERLESDGGESRSIQADTVFEVKGYWHEMRLTDDVVKRFEIREGDALYLFLDRVIRYHEVVDA